MSECESGVQVPGSSVATDCGQRRSPGPVGLEHLILDWQEICHVSCTSLQAVLDRYHTVFQKELGRMKNFEAKIHIDPNATPRFHRARSIPYSVRVMVEQELQRLMKEGTLEPVEMADWAAPIVPVVKQDRWSVQICGDFRQTVNPVAKLDQYPIPKIEDLLTTLVKGKVFTKIDLSNAYQQLSLDEASKQYMVVNTHKGLFRYTRLPFEISSAPAIFQRVIESLIQGIPGVFVYLDDILITGEPEEAHLSALSEVLARLEKVGLRAEVKVCIYDVSHHLPGSMNRCRWSSHIAREGGGCCESPTSNQCQPTEGVSQTTHVLQQVLTKFGNCPCPTL